MIELKKNSVQPPYSLLAELTHRCPLHCPYCSNPLEMTLKEINRYKINHLAQLIAVEQQTCHYLKNILVKESSMEAQV